MTDFIKTELPKIEIEEKWEEEDSIGSCPICRKGTVLEGKKSFFVTNIKMAVN